MQTYSLWASSSWSLEIRKWRKDWNGRRETVNTHWWLDIKLLIFVQWSSCRRVTRKVNKGLSRKCCFAFSLMNLPNVLHLYLRHITLVGNFTILIFFATFLFNWFLRWYFHHIIHWHVIMYLTKNSLYPQSGFSHSAMCSLHFVLSLHFVPSPMSDVSLILDSLTQIQSVCIWCRQILKSRTKECLKVLSSSGTRSTKLISVCNFPAR